MDINNYKTLSTSTVKNIEVAITSTEKVINNGGLTLRQAKAFSGSVSKIAALVTDDGRNGKEFSFEDLTEDNAIEAVRFARLRSIERKAEREFNKANGIKPPKRDTRSALFLRILASNDTNN